MVAASFWSLLLAAMELAKSSGYLGKFSFVPVALGFLFGANIMYVTDKVIPYIVINSASMMIQMTQSNKAEIAIDECATHAMEYGKASIGALNEHSMTIGMDNFSDCLNNQHSGNGCTRKTNKKKKNDEDQATYENEAQDDMQNRLTSLKRIILLVIAVTIHNCSG